MNYYKVKYKKDKKSVSKVVQAISVLKAKRAIKSENKNIKIISVVKVSKPMDIERFFNRKLSSRDYIVLIDNLAVIAESGLSLVDSIQDMADHSSHKLMKKVLIDIAYYLNQGKYLSEALKLSYEYTDSYTLSMIETGEESGTLDINLKKLAESLEVKEKNKVLMKKALRYPMFVSIAMIIAFVVIIIMIIPEFEDLFNSFNLTLPTPTLLLISLKDLFLDYGHLLIISIIALISVHKYLLKNNDKYLFKHDYFITKIPILGNIVKIGFITRYLHVFNTMDSAGISINKSVENALKSIDNKYLYTKFEPIYDYINTGKSLTYSFEQTGLFDSMDLASIRTGENSGTKDIMIKKVETKYYNRYLNLIDNISTSIEPLMIMFLIGFILILALGIFMPLWDISKIME